MSETTASSVSKSSRPVAALILAAGGATRMGASKAILPWRDTTLLGHCVGVARASACDEVCVIVGADRAEVEGAICGTDVQVIHHEQWQAGMGSTIATAIDTLRPRISGVMIYPCDQPFVTPDLLDSLLAVRLQGNLQMAACRYGDTVGSPAFFPESAFDSLSSLSGDRGAKSLLTDNLERITLLDFPLGAFDIDTREDYDRALVELAHQEGGG